MDQGSQVTMMDARFDIPWPLSADAQYIAEPGNWEVTAQVDVVLVQPIHVYDPGSPLQVRVSRTSVPTFGVAVLALSVQTGVPPFQ